MAADSPFGQATRMRVLKAYLSDTASITAADAWIHVYRCLLWMNEGAGLAHIYDSNHMQPGGVFHGRAVRFTELLCRAWGITRRELPERIDILFGGCVAELKRRQEDTVVGESIDPETESELISAIEAVLRSEELPAGRIPAVSRNIESLSRHFFTIGNKRKNALGEGFEDLLLLLLQRVARIPVAKLSMRTPVSKLPGFRRAAPRRRGERGGREPRPDIAVIEDNITHVITTAKWSMRQDRETQFQSEFNSYQMNKVQPTELRFVLITNEFDIARLKNVLRATPTGAGGYIFHNVYHVSLPLLRGTHAERFREIEPWVGTGQLQSLSDFLADMQGRYGDPI